MTTEFEPTPLMSTYLIGFVISDYEILSNELTKDPLDTLHRVSVSYFYIIVVIDIVC